MEVSRLESGSIYLSDLVCRPSTCLWRSLPFSKSIFASQKLAYAQSNLYIYILPPFILPLQSLNITALCTLSQETSVLLCSRVRNSSRKFSSRSNHYWTSSTSLHFGFPGLWPNGATRWNNLRGPWESFGPFPLLRDHAKFVLRLTLPVYCNVYWNEQSVLSFLNLGVA